ncbi:MAG: DUF4340 domain-containing protein [Planctomycetota bacterium]|nr:DUF4340 domain-containing protein [Planctomycetota bacterium]
MHVRSTVILCLIAVLGVIAAIVVHRREPAGEIRAADAMRPLLDPGALPVAELKRITLKRAGEDAFIFARDGATWRQVEPFAHPMQARSVDLLPTLAGEVVVVDTLETDGGEDALSPAMLGLDPPRAELIFAWPDGSLTMRFGRRGIAGRAYLRLGDAETVYVVRQDLHERAVDMDVKEWRDRAIFHDVGVDSDRIELSSAGGEIVLAREERRWKMLQPVPSRLDEAARDELLSALGRARSGGFILDQPEDLSRFGLASPAGMVAVTTMRRLEEGGEVVQRPDTQRLIVGARIGVGTQDRFGMIEGRPVVVRIGEAVLRAFFRQPAELVSRVASGVVAADVKTIRIDGPAGQFRLQREMERWIAPDHEDRDVPRDMVDELLSALTEARAEQIELAPYPRELEVATITFLGFDARPMDTVRIAQLPGAGDEPGALILENGDNVLRIHTAELSLPLTPEAFGLDVQSAG